MARWRLTAPHYLSVPGTNWEYQEVDRNTGRPARIVMQVPRYLNPGDPNDWTTRWGNRDNQDGYIVVCHGPATDNAIQFIGDPTPDMMPLDDEASAISASFAEHWSYKPDNAAVPFSQSIVDRLDDMLRPKNDPSPGPSVQVEGMSELLATLNRIIPAVLERRA